MSDKSENSFTDSAIWRGRKAALLEIAAEILPREEHASSSAEPAGSTAGLKEALQQEVVPYGNQLEDLFQIAYERQQRATCRRLLELLIQFTNNAAAFLERKGDDIVGHSLRYLWRELLNEASADLQIFEAAFEQRLPTTGRKLAQTENLFTADIVSEHALSQAVDNGFLPPTPIVTYLKDKITVRPVPYAAVVLISVAYATMLEPVKKKEGQLSLPHVSRDLLAIPHEIGHHIFWQARMPGEQRTVYEQLHKRLKQAKIWEWDWRRAWLEEIFADVYGLLVAGPVMALSFQDLLTDDPPAKFIQDNGHHPIPALRPHIQAHILRGITDAAGEQIYRKAPEQLDNRWQQWVTENAKTNWPQVSPLQMEYNVQGLAAPLSGQRILEALDEVIAIILQTLRAQRPAQPNAKYAHGQWHPWTRDLPKGDKNLLGLYDHLNLENFPLESRWLSYPEVSGRAGDDANYPQLILGGWSVEGPEDRGGG